MAYVFERQVQSSDITSNIFVDIPLGVRLTNSSTVFQSIYVVPDQVKENLKTLLLTQIGERYMQPEFGTNLLSIVFQPNVSELKGEIQEILETSIGTWLPYIIIEDLTILTAEDEPTLPYHVSVSLTYSIENFSTDTIKIYVNNNNTVSVV